MKAFTINNTTLYLCFKRRNKYLRFEYVPPVTFTSDVLDNLSTWNFNTLDTKKIVPYKMINPDQVQRMKRGLPYIMMTEKGAVKITPKNRRDAKGRFARKGKRK